MRHIHVWITFRQEECLNKIFSQIFAVLAVSFGCYIHGTTVVYTAVANPSIILANGTEELLNGTHPLPFVIYQDDINLFSEYLC